MRNRINFESFKVILQFAEKAANGDLNCQRAALSALAVSCEGCADSLIDGNHMPSLVEFAFTALQKDSAALRGAAIYTIGQFAEHNLIIDDLTEYVPKIIEKIIKILEQPTKDIIPHLQDRDRMDSIHTSRSLWEKGSWIPLPVGTRTILHRTSG